MRSKRFLALTALVFISLLIPAHAERPPNIIFIFADDWGFGDLSFRGHPDFKTPHLDKLAAEGTDFQQFTVAGSVCSPSRAAVMTGQYPSRHSVHAHFASLQRNAERGMPDWLDVTVPQLPRLLQQAGYATGLFGKWHLTNVGAKDAPLPAEYGYDEAAVFNGPGPQANPSNAEVDDKALAFIEKNKDRPFFLNVWLHETHTAHFPKAAYMEQFAHLDEASQVYAAVLAESDARVGRILDALDQHGLAENTLVIFSSDNGPEHQLPKRKMMEDDSYAGVVLEGYAEAYSVGSSGGLRGLKRNLYEGGIRVPFIVRWPGQTPATATNNSAVINGVDLLPTFCEIAGVALPEGYEPDGESFLPALRGETWQRSGLLFWQSENGRPRGDNWPTLAVRDGNWKLLTNSTGERVELYDIPKDPSESNDLAASHPERVAALRARIDAWRATLPKEVLSHNISKFR